MGLFDRIKKAGELALEVGKEAANKTKEVAEATKQAYIENGGAEGLGKLASEQTRKALEVSKEAAIVAANKTKEMTEATKQVYKDSGAEGLGKIAGEQTRKALDGAKNIASDVVDYAESVAEAGVKTGNKAAMVYSDKNQTSQDVTRAVLAVVGATRKMAMDGVEVTKNAIDKLDGSSDEKPKGPKPK